jgi:peptidoglycan/LPS O-acetylase OafA/YrhL
VVDEKFFGGLKAETSICALIMSPYVSQKIRHISLFLMVLVAFIHGYNINLRFSDGSAVEAAWWLQFLEGFISDGICRVAVPMFFAISGFLAVHSLKSGLSLSSLIQLWKKRFHTLVLPFFSVSALGIATVLVLLLIPFSRPFFNHFSLEHTRLQRWAEIFFLSPVPYQLWFLRFLIDYFLLFPVLYFLIRFGREAVLLPLLYFWSSPVQFPFTFLKPWISLFSVGCSVLIGIPWPDPMFPTKIELEGLFFFALGMYMGFRPLHWLEFRIRPIPLALLVIAWLGWIAFRTQLTLEPVKQHFPIHYHLIGFTLAGLFLFWFLFDYLDRFLSQLPVYTSAMGFTFGIFLFHEPFLTILKKGMIRLGGGSDLVLLVSFWLCPVLALLYSLYFSKALHQWLPGVYGRITGNRLPSAPTKPGVVGAKPGSPGH